MGRAARSKRQHHQTSISPDGDGMKTVYVVGTLPVLRIDGTVAGWVRADPVADGSRPSDMLILRDGSACGQAEAIDRIRRDPGLLYPTREEAVREGIARLRRADALGLLEPIA